MAGTSMVLFLSLMACGSAQNRSHRVPEKGLSSEDQLNLDDLLRCKSDELFDRMLEQISLSGKPSSILVITHAMILLPWEKDMEPKHNEDLRMRKLRVERVLDHLVKSSKHDGICAEYIRALPEEGRNLELAKRALVDWTIENMLRFQWDKDERAFYMKP